MIRDTSTVDNLGNRIDSNNNYERLKVLNIAREISAFTDPYFYPPAGYQGIDELANPVNSMTNTAINNFLAQMLIAFLPPNRLPYKLEANIYSYMDWLEQIEQAALEGAATQGFEYQPEVLADKAINELYQHYKRAERYALSDLEAKKARKSILDAIKHTSFAGNTLIEYKKDAENMRVYSLEDFAVERDYDGKVVEAVICDYVKVKRLDPKLKKSIIKAKDKHYLEDIDTIKIFREISYMSSIKKYEEVMVLECNTVLTDTLKRYKPKKLPYIFPVTTLSTGSNYGMPIIHSVLGHIRTAESLRRAVNDTSHWNSMLYLGLDPASGLNPKQIEKAKNGAVLPIKPEQLQMINKGAHNELQSMSKELELVNREIGIFFLSAMNSVRDGERVTATEIKMIRDEINKSKGTTYTDFENTMIHPMSLLSFNYLMEENKVNKEISDVDVKVITGVDAFTIEEDLMSFRMFIGDLANLGLIDKVNQDELIRRMSNLFNEETLSLIKTKEQQADEQMKEQEAMQQQQHEQLLQGILQGQMGGGQ